MMRGYSGPSGELRVFGENALPAELKPARPQRRPTAEVLGLIDSG